MTEFNRKADPDPISISKAVSKLITAFEINWDDELAKAIFEEAIECVYGESNFGISKILKNNIDSAYALAKAIDPKDDIEKMYTARVVLGQILGMHKLSQNYKTDQNIGMRLLKMSDSSMKQIYNRRSKL